MKRLFLALFFLTANLFPSLEEELAECYSSSYLREIALVHSLREEESSPPHLNLLSQSGYLLTPSALMVDEGSITLSTALLPPYKVTSSTFQLFHRLQLTANYRIYRGIPDPNLSQYGFGDLSDRGISAKILLHDGSSPTDPLPSITIGWDDFLGTKGFETLYIVATKRYPPYGLEGSLGYGFKRFSGPFMGCSWEPLLPFFRLKGVHLLCEWDPTDYRNPTIERHPQGRELRSRLNVALSYTFQGVSLTLGWIRGVETSYSISYLFPLGGVSAFLPKYEDPLNYLFPANFEAISPLRPPRSFAEELFIALKRQKIDPLSLTMNEAKNNCTVHFSNRHYLSEHSLKKRLLSLCYSLWPEGLETMDLILVDHDLPLQLYRLSSFGAKMHRFSLTSTDEALLLCRRDDTPPPLPVQPLLTLKEKRVHLFLLPKNHFLFGSSSGTLKYAIGARIQLDLQLFPATFLKVQLGYLFASNIGPSLGDRLNPSKLPIVKSDLFLYLRKQKTTLDLCLLDHYRSFGWGRFLRCSCGYFSPNYGGMAIEALYAPAHSPFAIGLEASYLLKRSYRGMGFVDWVYQLRNGVYQKRRFTTYQTFLDLYYAAEKLPIDCKLSLGHFIASDLGARIELTRRFHNGVTFGCWFTLTNSGDRINEKYYHDKGLFLSVPLEIFLPYSCKDKWEDGIAAWLRDCGYRLTTGNSLYRLIRSYRLDP